MHDVLAARRTVALRAALRFLLLLGVFFVFSVRAADTNLPSATFKITGYGVFGDLRLKRIIKLLEVPKEKPAYFDANFIEDSALILKSKIRQDGFLNPQIIVRVVKDDGSKAHYTWTETEPLPRPLRVTEVRFHIKKGLLFHYEQLQFSGLTALPEKKRARISSRRAGWCH